MIWHPESVSALYDFLRTTKPFDKWKLPPSDEVEFCVTRLKSGALADYHVQTNKGGVHRIRINYHRHNSNLQELCENVAHEMTHLACEILDGNGYGHGKAFNKRAAQVCKWHGFNYERF